MKITTRHATITLLLNPQVSNRHSWCKRHNAEHFLFECERQMRTAILKLSLGQQAISEKDQYNYV